MTGEICNGFLPSSLSCRWWLSPWPATRKKTQAIDFKFFVSCSRICFLSLLLRFGSASLYRSVLFFSFPILLCLRWGQDQGGRRLLGFGFPSGLCSSRWPVHTLVKTTACRLLPFSWRGMSRSGWMACGAVILVGSGAGWRRLTKERGWSGLHEMRGDGEGETAEWEKGNGSSCSVSRRMTGRWRRRRLVWVVCGGRWGRLREKEKLPWAVALFFLRRVCSRF